MRQRKYEKQVQKIISLILVLALVVSSVFCISTDEVKADSNEIEEISVDTEIDYVETESDNVNTESEILESEIVVEETDETETISDKNIASDLQATSFSIYKDGTAVSSTSSSSSSKVGIFDRESVVLSTNGEEVTWTLSCSSAYAIFEESGTATYTGTSTTLKLLSNPGSTFTVTATNGSYTRYCNFKIYKSISEYSKLTIKQYESGSISFNQNEASKVDLYSSEPTTVSFSNGAAQLLNKYTSSSVSLSALQIGTSQITIVAKDDYGIELSRTTFEVEVVDNPFALFDSSSYVDTNIITEKRYMDDDDNYYDYVYYNYVIYAVNDEDILVSDTSVITASKTVNGTIRVQAEGYGDATLYVTNTAGQTCSIDYHVDIGITSVTLIKDEYTFYKGFSYGLKYSTTPSNATEKPYLESSDTSICTVDSNGKITAVGVGTCKIYISKSYRARHNYYDYDFAYITVKSPYLSEKSSTVHMGECKTLSFKGGSGTITWSSTNTKIATVDKNGKITGKSAGTCTIKAKRGNVTLSCKVTVKKPEISASKVTLPAYLTKTISVLGGTGTTTWSTSNKKIATVDKTGKITAKSAGKCTISAKKNGKTYKCTVTVVKNEYSKNPSTKGYSYGACGGVLTQLKRAWYDSKGRLNVSIVCTNTRVYRAKYFSWHTVSLYDKNNKKIASQTFKNVSLNLKEGKSKVVTYTFKTTKKVDLRKIYMGDDWYYYYSYSR